MQIHSLYMRLHLSRLTSLVVIGVFVFYGGIPTYPNYQTDT